MQNRKIKDILIQSIKTVAAAICLIFIVEHYFGKIEPFAVSPMPILSFLILIVLNWFTQTYKKEKYFKPPHILLIVVLLFLAVHLRVGIYWASNTFPLNDVNMVLLTLQESFDAFAYSMIKQYLTTTILQTLVITAILTIFLYSILNSTTKRLIAIGTYFAATITLLFYDIPIFDYIHILNNKPEKSAAYSKFFVENYVNPDSINISSPEHKRNLILIYLESLETTFSDKEHGGHQDNNLIPEITQLAQQHINFGKEGNSIGGGHDARGSTSTYSTTLTRSLGIPHVINYSKSSALHNYKSLYKILNSFGYKQVFFQGNPGLFKEFRNFAIDQKIDEVYGPDDLIQRLKLNVNDLIKKQGYKTVQDKESFKFADEILDTITEPFSLTFFTIDTHAPDGIYDPDCVKIISNEDDGDERLKASALCVSRELNKFLDRLKLNSVYKNTSVVILGDHLFMGTRLVKNFNDRKWINIFINSTKTPIHEDKRLFSDIDMFPTILSSMNFNIDGDRLGLGTDLFSEKETLAETIGLDSLNNEIGSIPGHLIYEDLRIKKHLDKKLLKNISK